MYLPFGEMRKTSAEFSAVVGAEGADVGDAADVESDEGMTPLSKEMFDSSFRNFLDAEDTEPSDVGQGEG